MLPRFRFTVALRACLDGVQKRDGKKTPGKPVLEVIDQFALEYFIPRKTSLSSRSPHHRTERIAFPPRSRGEPTTLLDHYHNHQHHHMKNEGFSHKLLLYVNKNSRLHMFPLLFRIFIYNSLNRYNHLHKH